MFVTRTATNSFTGIDCKVQGFNAPHPLKEGGGRESGRGSCQYATRVKMHPDSEEALI